LNESDIYCEWAPPAGWRHAVVCVWEQRVARARVQRVLPDGHADLLFYDSGDVEVAGVTDTVALPYLPAGTAVFGVRLRPEAIGAALHTSAATLRNLSLPAEDVFGARVARHLSEPRCFNDWVCAIEPDPRVAAALQLLGAQQVEDVAALVAVSSRHLRRILLENVGITPKTFQSVLRLQRFVRAADRGTSLVAAAAHAGYADQAHLSREMRRFAGLTPLHLVQQRRAALTG
jgi:AraC-like DNA-binding protein